MRNLKKVLALVVAVAMIASIGLVASAASYTDVASNASYADAVNLLSNLGIITGYEDGTFRPDNTVTRAEAATMIVRMLNLDDEVEMGDTNFTDVAADNWASGYVNVAEANGIINGMGDGTFNPNGEVTYGQIVKMIVCALGYEPVALANGGYNGGGYLYAGSAQVTGFTKGVAGTANGAASRATVARLIYNALEVELMEQDSFSTGINGSEYSVQEDKTILSEYLELEKVDGVIVNTYLSSAQYEEGDNTVDLVITKNYAEKGSYDVADTVTLVADGTDAATLLGYTVVAYIGENEEGDDAVFAVAEKSGKNNVLVLDTELIETIGVDYIEYYKSESAKSTTEAEIQAVVEIKNNDVAGIDNMVVNGFNSDYDTDIVGSIDKLEEITLLDNDNDGDFEFVFATMPNIADNAAVEFVVATAVNEDDVWTWTDEDEEAEFEIDAENEDVLYTIVKDGKIVGADAIVEGDVITVLDADVNVITVYVSSVVVDGTVDEVDDDVYTINGSDYEISPIATDVELAAGDEGFFYVNASGKIASFDKVDSIASADFVYVIDAEEDNSSAFSDAEYLVQVVTAEGVVEVLTIKSKKVSVNDETNLEAKEAFDEIVKYGNGIAKIDVTTSGELSAIYFPGYEDFVAEEKYATENDVEYNEARGTYGIVDLTSDVLVFHIDTTEKDANGDIDYEEAVTVTTVGNLFVDESSYKFTAYGEEEEVPDVLVAVDAKAALDSEEPVMVVTKVSKVVADDDSSWKITGVVAGATVTVIVDPDEADAENAPVEKGNVILYAITEGYATDVQVLFESTSDAPATGVEISGDIVGNLSEEAVSVHYGEIEDKSSKAVTVDGDKFYFAEDVNVTVVDYSGANVSIKKGTLSDVKESNDKYTRTAFVKTLSDVEDEVSDVVVFVVRAEDVEEPETPEEPEEAPSEDVTEA